MNIYGKFKDYYDSALVYGQDPNCSWNRTFSSNDAIPEWFPLRYFGNSWLSMPYKDKVVGSLRQTSSWESREEFIAAPSGFIYNGRVKLFSGYVFFCGKVYPFIKLYTTMSEETFYTYESLTKKLERLMCERAVDEFLSTLVSNRLGYRGYITYAIDIERHLAHSNITCDEVHLVEKEPVYIVVSPWHWDKFHTGGNLKDYDFSKVYDPFTCLQELEMYISGVLGGQSPQHIVTSDVTRLEAKGFDKRTSFRNCK